jgi:hypothetical protein
MTGLAWRCEVAFGAAVAAVGATALLTGNEAELWLPIAGVGYGLVAAGSWALAPAWRVSRGQAVRAGLIAATGCVAGWIGSGLAVLVIATERCQPGSYTHEVLWSASYGLGMLAYFAASAWVLELPRRLAAWAAAPAAGFLMVLPVAAYAGICF